MKYFVLGGGWRSSCTGSPCSRNWSTNIGEIVGYFQNTVTTQREDTLVLVVVPMIVGLGFKTAAVPFHVWTPDVYEGAPTAGHRVHGLGRQGRRVRGRCCGCS